MSYFSGEFLEDVATVCVEDGDGLSKVMSLFTHTYTNPWLPTNKSKIHEEIKLDTRHATGGQQSSMNTIQQWL